MNGSNWFYRHSYNPGLSEFFRWRAVRDHWWTLAAGLVLVHGTKSTNV